MVTADEIESFFQRYGASLVSRDASAVAAHWAAPALVLSDTTATVVERVGEIEGFFAAAMGQYDGIEGASAAVQWSRSLSEDVAGADVVWTLLKAGGDTAGTERGFYVMKRAEGALRIQVYIPATTHPQAA